MKLATLKDGSRDGQLVVVSRDLSLAHHASGVATRLQQVLDDWNFLSPQLEDLYATLNGGKARHAFPFEPHQCMAPLPRACQWAHASGYLNHVALLRRAHGVERPEDTHLGLLIHQGGSDALLGPTDDAFFFDEDAGIDFGAGLAVITGDIPMGAGPDQALDGVRLLVLVNDWTLCHLEPVELATGLRFLHSKPATAFGPLAVTPDELGENWRGGRVHLPVCSSRNGRQVGATDAGKGMDIPFGVILAHLARTRPVRAGSIVGGGTVSHADAASGYSCIAEQRAREMAAGGHASTGYLRFGDRLRIEVKGDDGQSLFGAIEQRVVGPGGAGAPPAGPGVDADTLG